MAPLPRTVAGLGVLALAACGAPEPGSQGNVADAASSAAATRPTPEDVGNAAEPAPDTMTQNVAIANEGAAIPKGGVAPSSGPTTGGDGSAITMSAISEAEADAANLQGELACTFQRDGGGTLLLAKGDVDAKSRGAGIWKIADSVEPVFFTRGGGFNAMTKGGEIGGKGMTGRITLTSKTPLGGGESPPYPATLSLDRMDGAHIEIKGRYTCGP